MHPPIFGKLLGPLCDGSMSRNEMASSLPGNAVLYSQDSDDLHPVFGTTGNAFDLAGLLVFVSVPDWSYVPS